MATNFPLFYFLSLHSAAKMSIPVHTLIPDATGIAHATFDRHHGHSHPPFDSLNCSLTSGDTSTAVQANRALIKEVLGIKRMVSTRQVHGDQIEYIEKIPEEDIEIDGVDAMITKTTGLGLMIQHADCQAILLHDPVQSCIAAIHCGWRGSVLNIIHKTITSMETYLHTSPRDIQAGISPSLGPCCAEFIHYRDELPSSFLAFQVRKNHFDFWQISRAQLKQSGVKSKNIHTADICTSCNHNYFSYRRAKRNMALTGRNCSIIALNAEKI